jgi:hypothetical protein
MTKTTTALLLALATGCAVQSAAIGGNKALIRCIDGGMRACYWEAQRVCPGGYDVVAQSQSRVGLLPFITERNVVVGCHPHTPQPKD